MHLPANNIYSAIGHSREERGHPEEHPKGKPLGSGRYKSENDGEEGGRMKLSSWAKRSVEHSRQRHRKTGKAGSGPLGQTQAQ